jgi:hypothetical protein
MVRIYGPLTTTIAGGIVTMNFYDPEGTCSTIAASRSWPAAGDFVPHRLLLQSRSRRDRRGHYR